MFAMPLPARFHRVALMLPILCVPLLGRSQLVADGQTNFLDGITTNLSGVTIGTNGSFTLLVVTNGSLITNTALTLGLNVSAQSNLLVVTGAGSTWANSSSFNIGNAGNFNQLQVLAGGVVRCADAYFGFAAGSSSNTVLVSDPGSLFRPTYIHLGYASGADGNQLIVSNGATVSSVNADIEPGFNSNNLAIVTGPNSVWTNFNSLTASGNGGSGALLITNGGKVSSEAVAIGQGGISTIPGAAMVTGAGSSLSSIGYLYVGNGNPQGGNQLTVNNGGSCASGKTLQIGYLDNSNLLSVADPGTSVQCQSFLLGSNSTASQCIVSNGAILSVAPSTQPTVIEGTFTRATLTGPGTLWTNGGEFDFGQSSNVLSITRGAMLVDSNGVVENGAGKPNTVIISDPGSTWKNLGFFRMGDSSSRLLITNGATLIDSNAYFGVRQLDNNNTNDFALVAGAGSLWTNSGTLYVGYVGDSNKVLVTDSAVLKAGLIQVGSQGFGNQLIVSNSAFVGTPALRIGAGNAPNSPVTLTGGTIAVTNAGGNGVSIQYGTLTINSGLFMANSISGLLNGGSISFNGGTLQTAGTSYQNSMPFIVGDGTDPAVLTLMGGPHFFGGGLIVSNNGVLNGTGYITNNVVINSGGTISPGTNNTDLGILFVTGGVTLKPGSTTIMKLNALSNTCDQLRWLPTITFGGTLQLTNVAGTLQSGQSFQLFVSTPYLGAFSALNPPTPGPGLRWDTNQLNVNGFLRVFSTPTPPPQIAISTAADGSLVLTAQGIPYDPVYLLSSTNLSTPLTNWKYIATNYFDSAGNTSFTTPPPGQPQQFFEAQVN